jgi:NitT/TauT family transport system permease protein
MGNSTENSFSGRKRLLLGALGVVLALGLWAIAALAVASPLVLPDPYLALRTLARLAALPAFWLAVGGTILRVLEAFLASAALGACTGMLTGFSPAFGQVLSPSLTAIRATPVLALILLAMFWMPSGAVPVFVAILMAFPVFHTAFLSGMQALDKDLLEMSFSFHVPASTRLLRLRIPAARGYILSGARNALGLSWKVVVAGEILSQPRFALGTAMQDARLSLETASVFAWAIATVVLCGVSEYLLGLAARRFSPLQAVEGRRE